jgi:hypothetical protein
MFASESSSLVGAQRLAQAIESYWREKGVTVRCRIEQQVTPGDNARIRSIYTVRSDLAVAAPSEEAHP